MDVIGSGPERPAGQGTRWLRHAVTPAVRGLAAASYQQRRVAAVVAGVLVAACSVAALRAGLPEPATPRGASLGWTVLSGPPYDTLPGRTPIPPPRLVSEDGQRMVGELPVFAPAPSRPAVRLAVAMVLGRYCRDPAAHTVQLLSEPRVRWEPGRAGPLPVPMPAPPRGPGAADPPAPLGDPWQFAVALVSMGSSPGPGLVLTLYWTGYTYRWRGSLAQLNACR
jgi:hypothetical protein